MFNRWLNCELNVIIFIFNCYFVVIRRHYKEIRKMTSKVSDLFNYQSIKVLFVAFNYPGGKSNKFNTLLGI